MKILKYILTTYIVVVSVAQLSGQQQLTLKQAVEQAISSNNNVLIAKNNTEIAENQNTVGNAGYLPTVALNGNANYGISNSKYQPVSVPEPINITGAQNFGYGGNLALNYTIFGGLAVVNTHHKLKLNEENASIQERLNIERIVLQTIQAYCQALQAQNNLEIAVQGMAISRERLERTKVRYDMAAENKLSYLNAQVDYNKDSINVINAQAAFESSIYNLSQLTNNTNLGPEVQLDNELNPSEALKFEDLHAAARENNASLLNASYNSKISKTDLEITKSAMKPRLSLQSNYNFNHSENDGSFLIFNESNGFSGTLQLSIPIFDGHKKSIQYQNAKVRLENALLTKKEEESKLQRDLKVGYANYTKARNIAMMDDINIETAQINFERSQDLYDSGQISGTQFREAQLNLLNAKLQARNNDINLKLAEVELMRLSGQLIQ